MELNCMAGSPTEVWSLVVTNGATELSVRDRLCCDGFQVFCPYTREKARVEVKVPRTRANPNPRTKFEVVWRDIVRWPRYLFARVASNADIHRILDSRDVRDIVRGAEGEPATLRDSVVEAWMRECDTSGRLLKRSQVLNINVGDLLKFVEASCFAGHMAQITDTRHLDDSGMLGVAVDGRFSATVHYSELTGAIG